MAKVRTLVPSDIAAAVIFESDHTCCKCREPGRPVQIHHIDEDPSHNAPSNLAVLCLLCHDDTMIVGGFGRKLNADLVTKYRDDWHLRVVSRRNRADELAALRMVDDPKAPADTPGEAVRGPGHPELVQYIHTLPYVLRNAYQLAQPRWDSGVTPEMVQGSYDVIDVVVQILVHISSWFPGNHFGDRAAAEYFSQFVSDRFVWQRSLAEPHGIGTGGTIVGPITAASVLDDVERAVDEMVTALMWGREEFNLKAWQKDWKRHEGAEH